jgi:protein TonB
MPSRPQLPLETPVVPGEGKESGKPLPQGVLPKPSEGGARGGEAKTGEKGARERGKGAAPSKPGYVGRDALFDRKTIEEIARNDSGSGEGQGRPKKDDSITFDTEDYRYAGYMRNLRQKIESIWVYPPEAAAKGIYGDLRIRFTIRKDGRLSAVELVRTSGYKMLDDAAIKALKDGEPYWPLPDSWKRDSYTIVGHFIYLYGGYYLR